MIEEEETVRESDWIVFSACEDHVELKYNIDRVAAGLQGALNQRNIESLVAYNALISLLSAYTAALTQGDRVALDEICDSADNLIRRISLKLYKELYADKGE